MPFISLPLAPIGRVSAQKALFWDQTTIPEKPASSREETATIYLADGSRVDVRVPQIAWNQLYTGDPWTTVYLNGQPLPGISTAKATAGKRVDKLKETDSHGATHIARGYDPTQGIDIDVMLWTQPQHQRFIELMRVFWAPPGKFRPASTGDTSSTQETPIRTATSGDDLFNAAFPIFYPGLQHLRISAVTVMAVSGLEPGPVAGTMTCKIKCWEYFKPQDAAAKEIEAVAPVAPEFRTTEQEPHDNAPKKPSLDGKTGGL